MAEEEYGPWIDHDGKGFPREIVEAAFERGARRWVRRFERGGRTETPWEQANRPATDVHHPGWVWKRRFVLFGPWVASDPAYARILRYRFVYPRPASKAFQTLVEISQHPERDLAIETPKPEPAAWRIE